jgi:hypothetical protein
MILRLLLLLTISACASSRYDLRRDDLALLPEHQQSPGWTANTARPIFVDSLEDNRPIKNQIGEIKSGLLKSPTPVYLDQQLPYFVKNELSKAIFRRNIPIAVVKEDAPFILKGSIEQFWVSEYAPILGKQQAICQMKLDLALFKRGSQRPRWYGVTWVKVVSPQEIWDASQYAEAVVGSCFDEFAKNLFKSRELRALVEM